MNKKQIRKQLEKEKAAKQYRRELFCCDAMFRYLWDGEITMVFIPAYREWGIEVNDGGTSFIRIQHCPWCGSKLPESLRDKWFDITREMGYDDPGDDAIPQEYKSDQWWSQGDEKRLPS